MSNEVPEEIKDVESFLNWYSGAGYPFKPPVDGGVFVTDIAYSFCVYRHGRFQVEIYLVKPNAVAPEHSHPSIENIIVLLGGDASDGSIKDFSNTAKNVFGVRGPKITDSQTHSLLAGQRGAAFLSVEMWPEGEKIDSLSLRWVGDTCGSIHDELLKCREK